MLSKLKISTLCALGASLCLFSCANFFTSASNHNKKLIIGAASLIGTKPCDQTSVDVNTGVSGNGGDFSSDTYLPWEGGPGYYSRWSGGPDSGQDYFPIAVWLQQPSNAGRYSEIGINMFLGLWDGPTTGQLSRLAQSGMPVICEQNGTGLTDANAGLIRGWLQQDEPDNAQWDGSAYGPPVDPSAIVERYNSMKAADTSRPVYLNLGQGVAWDGWWGRGARTNHPEDYAAYAKGADILSYDIYPMNLDVSQSSADWMEEELEKVAGNIWYVAYGIDRLRQWSDYEKPVWMAVECTNFNNDTSHPPTPGHVKAEVWMAIIHGARGIIYFCHVFSPQFSETGPLDNADMSAALKEINGRITLLAPALNTRSVANGVTTAVSTAAVPVDVMLKRHDGYTYLFAVSMRPGPTRATFTLRDFPAAASAEVLGECRSISVENGIFTDRFAGYDVHIYKINPAAGG